MVRYSYLFMILLLLSSCNSLDFKGFFMPPSADVNKRFEESIAWNDVHDKVILKLDTTSYSIMVCADVHVSTTTSNWDKFILDLRNDDAMQFGIVVGDLSDGRGTLTRFAESLPYNPLTQKNSDTIFVTTGNHDLYFDDWELYKSYFGTSVYSFQVETPNGTDLFISLDSSSGTLGSKQKNWFKAILEKERSKHRHCVVYAHTNLFNTEGSQVSSGNMPIEEVAWITNQLSKHKVSMFINGHDHYKEAFDFGGVTYIVLDALKDGFAHPGYLTITFNEEVDYQFVNYNLEQ